MGVGGDILLDRTLDREVAQLLLCCVDVARTATHWERCKTCVELVWNLCRTCVELVVELVVNNCSTCRICCLERKY